MVLEKVLRERVEHFWCLNQAQSHTGCPRPPPQVNTEQGCRTVKQAENSICAQGGTKALSLSPDVAPKYCLTSSKNLSLPSLQSFLPYSGKGEGDTFIVSTYCVLDKSPEILKDNLYLHKYPRKYFFCLHTGKLRPKEHNVYAQGHSATNGNTEL